MNHTNNIIKSLSGWLGTCLSLSFFLSPFVLFKQLYKDKIIPKKIPFFMLICNFMNCLLWLCYSLRLKDAAQMFICNAIGGLITLCFIVYFYWRISNRAVLKFLGYVAISLSVIIIIVYICNNIIKNEELIGYVAMIFNVLLYAAPGQNIITICKSGDYTLLPILSNIIGVFCSLVWSCYGLLLGKISVIVPNIIGVGFSIVQVIVWIVFRYEFCGKKNKQYHQEVEMQAGNEDKNVEVNLSE